MQAPATASPAAPPPPGGELAAKGVPCSYCDVDVVGASFVLCAACEVPIHRDCWAEAGKCPAYGCGSTRATDPALALYRRKTAPTELALVPEPEPTPPAQAPATASPPVQAAGWRDLVSQIPQLVINALTGGGRISAVSIDLHLGGAPRGTAAAPPAAAGVTPSAAPHLPVPASKFSLAEVRQEIDLIERELDAVQWKSWIRTLGIVGSTLLLPLALKYVSKNLVFFWVVGIVAWTSLPIWTARGGRRRERALRQRLEELQGLEGGRH